MKVLIVEDEIFAALHLETAIQELGCEVIGIAPDSESALELAETGPDLALVDLTCGTDSLGRRSPEALLISTVQKCSSSRQIRWKPESHSRGFLAY